MIWMHVVSFQNNSLFYNSYFKCSQQGVFRIERITLSRYHVVILEKCEIVFKFLANKCSTEVLMSLKIFDKLTALTHTMAF